MPTNDVITIKQLAAEARLRAITAYGERAFARLCLDFESKIILDSCDQDQEEGVLAEGDELTRQMLGLLKMLARQSQGDQVVDSRLWHLALIWFDGRGWGEWSVEGLNKSLSRLRRASGNSKPFGLSVDDDTA